MQRLFSAFPGGRAGVALLLLRASVAAALALPLRVGLEARVSAPWEASILGAVALAGGAALALGFMTPLAATLAIAYQTALAILSGTFVPCSMVAAIAVVLLGPGSFSVDARLFGRREMLLSPRPPRRPDRA